MSVLTRRMLLAAGLAAVLVSTSGVASADAVSQDLVDARQESRIGTTFALSTHLRGYKLQALVQSGLVRITGTVAEDAEKELAGRIASEVNGVLEVNNQILVQPGYAPAPKSAVRSFGEAIDDAEVSAEVRSKIAWSASAQALRVLVDTNLGAVRLRGMADSEAAKLLAGRLAATTRGVASVDNQITVTGPQTMVPGSASAQGGPELSGDSWITAKVTLTLLYSINCAASDISVSSRGGDVTLSGRARNGAERALAVELAQQVRGVGSVHPQGLTF